MTTRRRIPELDGLRGLAALVVVLGHWLSTLPVWWDDTSATPGHGLINAVKYSPLRVAFAAPEAVLVFFVLSGFVLALPWFDGRPPAARAFWVRRVLRIYPPLWVALAGAAVLAVAAGHPAVAGGSSWLNLSIADPVDGLGLLGHADLLRAGGYGVDPVVWSMVHELRVSLVFPLLVAGAAALGAWRVCGLAAVVSFVAVRHTGPHPGLDLAGTGPYLLSFALGIALARHRPRLPRRRAAALVAVLALTTPYTVGTYMPWFERQGLAILVPTAGAALLVALAPATAALRGRVAQYLGRISYSLYLWHLPILFAVVRATGSGAPPIVLAPAGIAAAVLAAELSRRWIEAPSSRAGAILARWATPTSSSSAAPGRRGRRATWIASPTPGTPRSNGTSPASTRPRPASSRAASTR